MDALADLLRGLDRFDTAKVGPARFRRREDGTLWVRHPDYREAAPVNNVARWLAGHPELTCQYTTVWVTAGGAGPPVERALGRKRRRLR